MTAPVPAAGPHTGSQQTGAISAEALRSVDPAKLAKRIAETKDDIARQEAVVEWLSDQHDGEERQLLNLQHRLADLRKIAAQLEASL